MAAIACNSPAVLVDQIVSLDEGGAVLIEKLEGRKPRLVRIDRDGDVRWSQVLEALPQDASLATHHQIVTMRRVDEFTPGIRTISLEAFDLDSGKLRWRAPLDHYVRDGREPDTLGGMQARRRGVDATFLHEPVAFDVPGISSIVTLDLDSGTVRGRIAAKIVEVSTVGADAYIHGILETTVVGRDAATTHPTIGPGCVSAAEYVRLFRDRDFRLALSVTRENRETIVPIVGLGTSDVHAQSCGFFGDEIVVVFSSGRETIVAFMAHDGVVRAALQLEGSVEKTYGYSDRSMVGGEPPRYVPLMLVAGGGSRVAWIDLVSHRVVRETRAGLQTSAFRTASVWYVVDEIPGGADVSTIDGVTGEPIARVVVRATSGLHTIDPSSVTSTGMWIASAGWGAHRSVARLDVRTLAVESVASDIQVDQKKGLLP